LTPPIFKKPRIFAGLFCFKSAYKYSFYFENANIRLMNDFKKQIHFMTLEAFKDTDACIFLFGSRVDGTSATYSDYDLGFFADIDIDSKIVELKEAFQNSNIPFKVDLVNFSHVSTEFKKIALAKVEIWKDPKNLMQKLN
jgi:predicted nucleotidyltransferase